MCIYANTYMYTQYKASGDGPVVKTFVKNLRNNRLSIRFRIPLRAIDSASILIPQLLSV